MRAHPQRQMSVFRCRVKRALHASSTEDVAVEHHTISNCGHITIIKHTDPRGLDQVFSYASNLPANAQAGGVSGIDANGSFSLNDKNNTSGDSTLNTVSEQAFARLQAEHLGRAGPGLVREGDDFLERPYRLVEQSELRG
jgi:hypothetical protein